MGGDAGALVTGAVPALRVLSYNLRYASEDDPQPWSRRRAPMVTLLSELAPDLIGTQEGLDHQLADLADGLGERYRWVGQRRHGGSTEEYSAIFYAADRLVLTSVEHHWLSDTPEVPGSCSWGNDLPRLVSVASFTDRSTGRAVRALNTHFDHVSRNAQRRAAIFVRALIEQPSDGLGEPEPLTVLFGDFNVAVETSEPYAILLDTPLQDAFLSAERRGPRIASFADYAPPAVEGERIDWIMVSPGVRVRRAEMIDRAPGGQYPSDHLPVLADLDLTRGVRHDPAASAIT